MIVVDCSVAVKWVRTSEEDADKAYLILTSHLSNKDKIIVPDFIFIELANVLVTKSRYTDREVRQGLNYIFKTNLNITKVEKEILMKSAMLANKYKTTIYDMIYAVIAKKHKALLITTDENFIEKTKFSYVKLLSEYTTS